MPRVFSVVMLAMLALPSLLACGSDDADDGSATTLGDSGPGASTGAAASSSDTGSASAASGSAGATAGATTSASGATSLDGTTSLDEGSGSTATADASADASDGEAGPPALLQIMWEHAQPCQSPQEREVTVTVTVDDPDTPAAELAFSGGIAGCDGEIDAAVSTLVCTGSSNHVGAVTVMDARGGSDDGAFTVIVCRDGTADF